jgi:hypothetical protein
MNQTLYLIGDTFFDNPDKSIKEWVEHIEENCKSERAVFVYDPICMSLYRDMMHNKKAFKQLVAEYYQFFQYNWKAQLTWGELDGVNVEYINSITNLLYNLNWKNRSICSYGCLPLSYKNMKMYLFFFIAPNSEEKFYLISEKDFLRNHQLIIDTREMIKG